MKKTVLILSFLTFLCSFGWAQSDKSQRPSPPDSVKVTTEDGVTIDIHYSKPSLKGRQLGVDIAPAGQVWRTGANEATTFEVDKDVTVDGKPLPAGKYSIHSIPGEYQTTVIINKVWKKWGTQYDQNEDALRVDVSNSSTGSMQEQLNVSVAPSGLVTFAWGEYAVPFTVKAAK